MDAQERSDLMRPLRERLLAIGQQEMEHKAALFDLRQSRRELEQVLGAIEVFAAVRREQPPPGAGSE